MPDVFNLTGEALRKMMIVAVDVSGGGAAPSWEVQGYKTEDTSIEFNPDSTTITDVLGDTYTDVNKFEEQITFEPNTLRMGAKLAELMHQYWRDGALGKFALFRVLVGFGYLGTEGAWEADVYEQSTIFPNSLGGSSRVDFPFTINLGGEKTKGTIDQLRTGLTFTAAS